jgi:hypothetical protein
MLQAQEENQRSGFDDGICLQFVRANVCESGSGHPPEPYQIPCERLARPAGKYLIANSRQNTYGLVTSDRLPQGESPEVPPGEGPGLRA